MISVIVPAFNEEDAIATTIREIGRALCEWGYEIVVVDDGSLDRTAAIVEGIAGQDRRVRLVKNGINQGKGEALKQGFLRSGGDPVVFIDADMELHPGQIPRLLQVVLGNEADVTIGTKHSPASVLHTPGHRRFASSIFRKLVHQLFDIPVSDTQTGLKVFRREVLRRAFPRVSVRRYAFDLELLVAAGRFGARIVEVPVEAGFHRQGWGRIGLKSTLQMGADMLDIYYRASFWKWLQPSLAVRLYMLALAAGIATISLGAAHLLTLIQSVPAPLEKILYLLTLRFLDKQLRDWLMIAFGFLAAGFSLMQLNKSLLAAFARADGGDLAGIHRATSNRLHVRSLEEASAKDEPVDEI
jgi:glycosyltransferase involved in cell wall biosynthesis